MNSCKLPRSNSYKSTGENYFNSFETEKIVYLV